MIKKHDAFLSEVRKTYSWGWILDHPDLATKSLHKFHTEYSQDYVITKDERRAGFVTYIATAKEEVNV